MPSPKEKGPRVAALHTFRYPKVHQGNIEDVEETRIITRTEAVALHCLSCVVGSRLEVKNCDTTTCALWPFRMGV